MPSRQQLPGLDLNIIGSSEDDDNEADDEEDGEDEDEEEGYCGNDDGNDKQGCLETWVHSNMR